jgi:excinuclease UvrABC helicase subunit UvrB
MKTTRFIRAFLSTMVAIGLFAASSAFADAELMNGQNTDRPDSTVIEVFGDQRIVEIDASDSSVCIVDSMVSGDQRRPDRHKAGLDGTSIETDECHAHDYMMPMNR